MTVDEIGKEATGSGGSDFGPSMRIPSSISSTVMGVIVWQPDRQTTVTEYERSSGDVIYRKSIRS